MELIRNKYTQGEAYQIAQEITNIRKLFGVHFFPLSAIYLSSFLIRVSAINNPCPIAGFTHGSRNAVETVLFQHFLQKLVLGSDISSSANFFPQLIRHDMNHPLPMEYGNGSLGFVFSNSWDHSNNPNIMFANWISSLDKNNGYLILEKQSSSGSKSTISDPFSASDDELISLVSKVSEEQNLGCHYVGSMSLSYVPKSIVIDCNHPLVAGTATCLHELEPSKMFLTGFNTPPSARPLKHHIFTRSQSPNILRHSASIVSALNKALNLTEPDFLEGIFRMHPANIRKIDFLNEFMPIIMSQCLLANVLKEKIFLDARGDSPGESANLASEVDSRLKN